MTLLIYIQLSSSERIKRIKLQSRKLNSNIFNTKLYSFVVYKLVFNKITLHQGTSVSLCHTIYIVMMGRVIKKIATNLDFKGM